MTNMARQREVIKIVHEVLGTSASYALLKQVCSILDEDHEGHAALKLACAQIEKMVNLFHGNDKAQPLGKRFNEMLTADDFPAA